MQPEPDKSAQLPGYPSSAWRRHMPDRHGSGVPLQRQALPEYPTINP